MWTKKSAKKVRKQVRGCLQNLYQSVAIHLIQMASTSTPSTNVPAKYLILIYMVQLKPIIKANISGRMFTNSISDVVTASVNSEKTCLKLMMMMMKMMMMLMIIIMIKLQETTVFGGHQKLTSAMKLRPEK